MRYEQWCEAQRDVVQYTIIIHVKQEESREEKRSCGSFSTDEIREPKNVTANHEEDYS